RTGRLRRARALPRQTPPWSTWYERPGPVVKVAAPSGAPAPRSALRSAPLGDVAHAAVLGAPERAPDAALPQHQDLVVLSAPHGRGEPPTLRQLRQERLGRTADRVREGHAQRLGALHLRRRELPRVAEEEGHARRAAGVRLREDALGPRMEVRVDLDGGDAPRGADDTACQRRAVPGARAELEEVVPLGEAEDAVRE